MQKDGAEIELYRKNLLSSLKELLLGSTEINIPDQEDTLTETINHVGAHEGQLSEILRGLREVGGIDLAKELITTMFTKIYGKSFEIDKVADGMLHTVDDELGTNFREQKLQMNKQ